MPFVVHGVSPSADTPPLAIQHGKVANGGGPHFPALDKQDGAEYVSDQRRRHVFRALRGRVAVKTSTNCDTFCRAVDADVVLPAGGVLFGCHGTRRGSIPVRILRPARTSRGWRRSQWTAQRRCPTPGARRATLDTASTAITPRREKRCEWTYSSCSSSCSKGERLQNVQGRSERG